MFKYLYLYKRNIIAIHTCNTSLKVFIQQYNTASWELLVHRIAYHFIILFLGYIRDQSFCGKLTCNGKSIA